MGAKFKGKNRFCYASIRLYDKDNPKMIQFFLEQEHSIWCDTNYILERNETLKQIISVLNKKDNIYSLPEEIKPIKDEKYIQTKILNYFNEYFPQNLIEVKNYCNIAFKEYNSIINKPNFLKNLFYPWKRNWVKFTFYSIFENIYIFG